MAKSAATTPKPVVDELPPVITSFVDTAKDEDEGDFVPPALEELPEGAKERYFEATGRRKESIARVRLVTRKAGDNAAEDHAMISINGRDYVEYFQDSMLRARVESPLKRLKSLARFKVTAKVSGGGTSGQADAVRHGISRTLELFDANFRKKLKKAGFLTRDPRIKERRKPGLKKARKAPRWSKR